MKTHNRTCKLCGLKQDSSLLTHKGNAVFHCKDTEGCHSRTNSEPPTKKGYVVTSVVEGKPLELEAFLNLEFFCQTQGYDLKIMSIAYKNPEGESEPISERVLPYLVSGEEVLNGQVRLLGDLQVRPTAINPLSGLNPCSRGLTSIVPHTQLALESIATAPNDRPIFLYTTGCITQPVYSDTLAGYKAKFHHSLSAILVEFDEANDYYIRTLPITHEGIVTDLGQEYSYSQGVKSVDVSIVLGDSHVGYTDRDNDNAIHALRNYLKRDFKHVVLHDVFDGDSVNHHNLGQVFNQKVFNNLEDELEAVRDYIDTKTAIAEEVLIVDSNHHHFLEKWAAKVDIRNLTSVMQKAYHQICLAILEGKDAFETLLDNQQPSVKFIRDSYFIQSIDVSIHGHAPVNGGRSSTNSLNNLGYKTISGHTHSARIRQGAYVNGTSSLLRLPYMAGFSSHSHTHTLIFENGKRQMFTTFKGKYRA